MNDQVHCSLIMGKSRVAPIKPTTIPRLELTAATVAVKQNRQIREELDLNIDSVTFWTDSTCVLQYINNEAGRFKTFVANRIAIIHANSNPSCWRYVDSKANPADFASRGLRSTDEFEIDQWINGPNFLRSGEEIWPTRPEGINVLSNETLEWKKNVEIYETQVQPLRPLDVFIQYYSSWFRCRKGSHGLFVLSTISEPFVKREIPRIGHRVVQIIPVMVKLPGPGLDPYPSENYETQRRCSFVVFNANRFPRRSQV